MNRISPVAIEPAPPLFQTAWWLDKAGNGSCETVEQRWDGRLVGALTFLRTRRLGMTVLRMPPYTRTLSPLLAPPPSKPSQRIANIRRIVQGLIAGLPRHDRFEIALDPEIDPAVAFAFDTAGLSVAQAFTFRVGPDDDLSLVWQGMDQKTRNVIRGAQSRCALEESAEFDRFERLSLRDRGRLCSTHDFPLLRRLHEAAHARRQAAMVFAVQPEGDAAAVILVWDQSVMYYWTTARDRRLAGGASSLLLWHAIGLAHARGLILDMDGYCAPAGARFLAGFGMPPVVRPVVSRASRRFRAARLVRQAVLF